jgi:crossover junction endodeoxyribonuclease RuvC
MRVLGIDPGTRRTGYGVIDVRDGVMRHVASGVIAPRQSGELHQRLLIIFQGLQQMIETYRPEAVSVEDIFFAKHAQGALKLGHARGVALLAAALVDLPLYSYPPAQVKRALSGHGRADKGQVIRLVTMVLQLDEEPKEDQADALAIAICHVAKAGWLVR